MPDIRQQVEEDRGLLKKIQLVIPGLRGYRKREDIRAADSILRLQMADGLVKVREGLEESRRVMTDDYQTKNINKSRTLEGKVRHAEQGYSGFSATVRIEEEELNRLYEYDASMIDSIMRLDSAQANLLSTVQAGDENEARRLLDEISNELVAFERTFEDRIPRVAGIYNL